MFIGVTGQIGAGKTTAAQTLSSFGAAVIDADQIGHQVVDESAYLRRQLARQFGDRILSKTGRVNRRRLARLAFADRQAKKRLDDIVHPYLLRKLRRRMRELSRKSPVVVIDAALLLDWNLDREMDVVLVVHASWRTRFDRVLRKGLSEADALARRRAQLPFREYRRRADRVVLNNGTREHLREKLEVWYQKILGQTD